MSRQICSLDYWQVTNIASARNSPARKPGCHPVTPAYSAIAPPSIFCHPASLRPMDDHLEGSLIEIDLACCQMQDNTNKALRCMSFLLHQTEVTLGRIPHVFNTLCGIIICRCLLVLFRPSYGHVRIKRWLLYCNSSPCNTLEDLMHPNPRRSSLTTTETETLGTNLSNLEEVISLVQANELNTPTS